MGQLNKLIYLDVSNNLLEGVVSETHFAKLSMLKYFFASFNPKLSFNISRHWMPPFQLTEIRVDSCNISSEFPWWLRTQTKLRELVMSNSSISGYLPKWLRKMSVFQLLDLSHNQLSGPVTNLPTSKPVTGFGFNLYRGSLFLKNNFFSGSIPESLCKWTHLEVLDLSKNRLSGKILRCLGNLINLKAMVFYSNELSGVIPNFLGNMPYSLTWLNLNNNSLRGELPISLETFYDLRVLDLGDNELSGRIPKCIGDCLYHLVVLTLQEIREQEIAVRMVMKGVDLEYTTTLQFFVNMDLSSNKLVGKIPEELTTLAMLVGLNMSHNNLSGGLPDTIGNMKALNSLDFSVNKVTGMIPSSMASLTFLSYLNLSHNNFSGRIPIGNQLQTLGDPSIYAGNRDLCGAPLLKNWSNNEDQTTTSNGKYEEVDEPKRVWFYLDVACGFATGFWCVIGVLLLKKRWRHKLFMFSEVVMDKIHVAVAVRVAKMKRGREAL
nr:leucine-rich repeat protein [Tanacetum cinerariifolium]